jgi:long-chain fatty acid transport protein
MRTMNAMTHRRLGKGAALSAALLLGSPSAFAGGFQINEHSAVNTGRASSVVATVKDPSAIWHNPAGLTNIEGTEFQVGVSLIKPRGNYVGPGTPSTNANYPNPRNGEAGEPASSPIVPVPNIYAARALSSKAYVGLGFYAPYGLGIKWEDPDNFSGRTVVQELSLRSFFITPAIALKLSDMVSVAVGVSLVPATAYLKRSLGASDNGEVLFPARSEGNKDGLYEKEGTVEISGSAFGVGANAGVQVTLIDHLKLGLAFRSAIDLSFSGDANFDLPADAPSEIKANFPDGTGTLDVTLPHTFLFGVGWVQGGLTIEASSQLTLWNSYDELRLNFASGLPTPSSASPRDWKVVPLFRLGAEYMVLDALAVRAGVGYDISPVPSRTVDPTLPDNNRIYFSLGAGYDFGYVRADVAYMGLLVAGRTLENGENVNFPIGETNQGEYSGGMVHVMSVSIGAKI